MEMGEWSNPTKLICNKKLYIKEARVVSFFFNVSKPNCKLERDVLNLCF